MIVFFVLSINVQILSRINDGDDVRWMTQHPHDKAHRGNVLLLLQIQALRARCRVLLIRRGYDA